MKRRSFLRYLLQTVVVLLALTLVIGLFVIPGQAAAKDPIKMVIAHHYPSSLTDNEVQPALYRFKDLVEKGTKGGIKVEIYPNCILGTQVQYTQATIEGKTIQSSTPSSGAFSSFWKSYQVIAAPFLFPDYRTAWDFFDSEFFASFMDKMRKDTGLRYLGTFDDGGGFVAVTNDKRLIKTPEDVKGLRMRCEENPAHFCTWKSLGASVMGSTWPEVTTILATNVADGQYNAPGLNAAMKFWEVTDYSTWLGIIYNTLTWVVNDEWFKSLPEDYQRVIIRAAREVVPLAHGIAEQASLRGWDEAKKHFKACYVPTAKDKEAFRKVAQPAYFKWITDEYGVDPDLVSSVWDEVDKVHKMDGEEWWNKYGK